MNETQRRQEVYRRSIGVLFVAAILVISFLIIRPFITAILSAAALAYVFYPLYLRILSFTKSPRTSSLSTCFVIILIVLIPTISTTLVATYEIKDGYDFLRQIIQSPGMALPHYPSYLGKWSNYLPQVGEIATDIAGQVIGFLQGVLQKIPNLALNVFITIFSIYYFLVYGRDFYHYFSQVVPLPEGRYKQLLQRFDDLSRGMIMGQVVVSIIQGILAGIGFYLLGVPKAVLWGFLTAIISVIPLLGAAIVWVPISVYLFILALGNGAYWKFAVLLIYGTCVISFIDNILKPKIVGERAKIHPLLILFGILGGLQLFGIAGLLIGPLILTIFDVIIAIYKDMC